MIEKTEAQIRSLVCNKKLADTLIEIKKDKEKPRKKKKWKEGDFIYFWVGVLIFDDDEENYY